VADTCMHALGKVLCVPWSRCFCLVPALPRNCPGQVKRQLCLLDSSALSVLLGPSQPQVLESMSCVHCELFVQLSLTAGGLLWPPFSCFCGSVTRVSQGAASCPPAQHVMALLH
jgi:hypothetical protein